MSTGSYHHGALRPALLSAAAAMLEQDGLEGVSLRAIARAAGVSHAAPAHHFGDLRGLLTALASDGFRRFAGLLAEAAAAPGDKLRALGRAYVRFAQMQPGLFLLMFHNRVLDGEDAELRAAAGAAFAALQEVTAARPAAAGGGTSRGQALASWCLVHGFAMLLLDGRLPAEGGAEGLLGEVFG